MAQRWDRPVVAVWLAAAAFVVALIGAKPYAGGWNDGCRLAAVESLVERGSFAIDGSVFCGTPARNFETGHLPYPADRYDLHLNGPLDKLFVNGQFHSDKPAVPNVLTAGMYRSLMFLGAPSPSERPDLFAWILTVFTAGLGYAVAVGCVWRLGTRIGLEPRLRALWLFAFAFATYAPTYTQHANAHAPQLGTIAVMILLMLRVADAAKAGTVAWGSLVALGTLTGLAFNFDFGSGPPLVAALFLAVAWRTRRVAPTAVFTLAVLPWLVAAVGINFHISGKWLPMNMYAEHYQWPGSPFSTTNLTGFLRHEPLDQFLYAAAMWFGKHGFLNHNLPTLLLLVAGWGVLRRITDGRIEMFALLAWALGAWLMYAVLSNNMGGACCSVRWFVPYLAPAFWALGLALRDRPEYRRPFALLAGFGFVLAAVMWWKGPWTGRMIPMMWPIVGLALISWGVMAWREKREPNASRVSGLHRFLFPARLRNRAKSGF